MIDAERLLGSLLKQGLKSGRRRRRGRSSGLGGLAGGSLLGMGLLGVAVAAFEHFTQQKGTSGVPPGPPSPQPVASSTRAVPPPPPPGAFSSLAPPLPPPAAPVVSPAGSDTGLLIQAMVAAANADGEIDSRELKAIRRRMAETGLSPEEKGLLERLLAEPPTLEAILKGVRDPRLGVQIYAVTLAAIEVDTPAERAYLEKLRSALNLPSEVVEQLHQEFDNEER